MSIYKKNQPKGHSSSESPYKRQLIQIAKLANYEPIASIPSPTKDFNFTYAKDGHLMRKIKNQSQQTTPSYSKLQSKGSPPHSRLPRIETKPNRLQNHPTNASQPNEQLLTLDTRVQTEQFLKNSNIRSVNSPLSSPIIKENPKKPKLRYKIKQLNTQQSDQNEQYQDNATPGPGYYSSSEYSTFNTSNSKSGLTNFSFGSKASRFILQKPQSEPKIVKKNPESPEKSQKTKQIVRRKKLIPFLSCSFKKNDQLQKQKTPGPQDYYTRSGIQQQLIRKIQRNFKGNFGTCEQRFRANYGQPNLGPGAYSYQSQQPFDVENSGSYYFMSQKKRFQ